MSFSENEATSTLSTLVEMPHQTRLVELLIASPEVSVITFSPKPLKLTNSSNEDLDYSPSPSLILSAS